MINILVIYEQESVSQKLLCDFLCRYSNETGNTVNIKRSRNISSKDIGDADLLITIRSMAPLETTIVKIAKESNIPCICYWDDDLTQNTDTLYVPKKRREAMIEELKYADAILASNQYLSNKLASYGNNPLEIIIDTVVDKSELYNKTKNSNVIKIVYAAGPSHKEDFSSEIEQAFVMLQDKLPGQFSLSFVGVKPALKKEYSFPIEYIPPMNVNDYRSHMRSANYDIGLAPIPHSEFSKSKYYNKYIEYTIVNVVGIYSDFPPYSLVIRGGINGYLADDTAESWYEALFKAITDNESRKKCLDRAKDMLQNDFSFEAVSSVFSKGINELEYGERKKVNAVSLWISKVGYRFFKYIYLPTAYLSKEGFSGTLKRINNYTTNVKLLKKA